MSPYFYTGFSVFAQGASIVYYLLLARSMSPGEYGSVMACISVSLLLSGLVNFGGNFYLVREIASGRFTASDIVVRVLSRVLYSAIVAGVAGVFFFYGPSNQDTQLTLGSSLLLVTSHSAQLLLVYPLARRRLLVAGSAQVLDKLTSALALMIALQVSSVSPSAAPLFMVFGNLISIALIAVIIRLSNSFSIVRLFQVLVFSLSVSRRLLFNPWRGSARIGVSSLCFSAQQLDVAIIESATTSEIAGEYAAVARATQPTSLVASSLGQAMLPRLSAAESLPVALRLLRALWPALLAIIVAAVVGAVYADNLVMLLLGESYDGSSGALAVLLLTTPISFVSQMLFVLLTARGLDSSTSVVVVVSTTIGLCLQYLLPQHFGSLGAAIAFILLQLLLVSGFLWVYMRNYFSRQAH